VVLALGGEEFRPGDDLGVLLEQGATLTLGHAAPDAELDSIVQGVGAAFGHHRTVSTDHRGLTLRGTPNKKFVRVGRAAAGLGNPGNPGLRLGALD
jgi:hypothetical protein